MKKLLLLLLMISTLLVSSMAFGVIRTSHFEGGSNLTQGGETGQGNALADLIIVLQNATSTASLLSTPLTGYSAGTSGAVDALLVTDSILEGIQKLDGNKADYIEDTFTATFDGDTAVGAKTVVVRKIGKNVTLEIPSGTTVDPGAQVLASGATDITAAYRPAADLSFIVVVTDNTSVVLGSLTVSAAGQLTFGVGAAGGVFTDAAAAGFDRISVTYTLP